MSLLLWVFYLFVVPALIISLVNLFVTKSDSSIEKSIYIIIGIFIFSWYLWEAVGENWLFDRKVKELCVNDGGIKIYETVPLSPEMIDEYNIIIIPTKRRATKTDQYYYEFERKFIRKGRPEIWRSRYSIVRRKDNKILGELVNYARRGGGLPGPWHDTSYSCPKTRSNQSQLKTSVFVKK